MDISVEGGVKQDEAPAITIRKGRLADLDRLVAIENAAFEGDRLTRRSLRAHLTKRTVTLLVAEAEAGGFAQVIGYALIAFRKESKKARLYSIATDPEYRLGSGRGLGRVLLAACEAQAARRGMETLVLEVRADNARAIALYEARGYAKFGTLADYYEDGAAAVRYEKRLSA
ncbi:MAG: [ribosomal protein S18]-alanine N-acetyltransferase [Methylobacteriaceae bacterium]|jgi:ribosomal protein S18 acetylase RimI-like enzyme|nr:[ribosomal protein S18]-alanine N-acetyltransferase [Methylobacteriaceae bacterium]